MKNYILTTFAFFSSLSLFATTTYTVGASRTYTTIAAAYAACSGATDYVIEIYNDYSYSGETGGTANITLGTLASKSASNTVTIRPASGQSLSFSSTATFIFDLNGADWVRFDGRAGGSGASAWTMINTSAASNKSVFGFRADATNNVVKYCLLKGDCFDTGLILFSTSASGGNDNNTIDNCTIRENSTKPYYLIQSAGSSGANRNSGITISNCNLVNFQASAIYITQHSDTWTITNNHFYQTSSLTIAGGINHNFISIADAGSNAFGHNITGNFFGGQAINCGGSAYEVTSSGGGTINIIKWINSIATGNTISNNTFANLELTTDAASAVDEVSVCGIYVDGAGQFTIGSSGNGNTFGSTTGTSSIVVTTTAATSSFSCILKKTYAYYSIEYNTFGAIDYSGTSTSYFDIIKSTTKPNSTGTTAISNNTIGNSTANNIYCNTALLRMSGIYSTHNVAGFSIPENTVSDNTIQNFKYSYTGGATSAKLYGFYTDYTNDILHLSGNNVRNFTFETSNPSDNTGSTSLDYSKASVIGIGIIYPIVAGIQHIDYNRVFNLSSTYTGATPVYVVGILFQTDHSATQFFSFNKVRSLSNASASNNSLIAGITFSSQDLDAGVSSIMRQIWNNVVLISDAYTASAKKMYGIMEVSTEQPFSEYFHNTVSLTTAYSAGSANTAAFYMSSNLDMVSYNNIFQNLNTGGSGKHYSQYFDATIGSPNSVDIQFNFNENSVAGNLVNWLGVDKAIATWQTQVGNIDEISGSILVSSTTGAVGTGSAVENAGTPITSMITITSSDITTDYDGNPRNSTNPWIGAFESIIPLPIELLEISAKCQKSKTSNSKYGATIKWITATEKNSDYFIIEGSKDGFIWEVKDTVDGSGTKYDPTNYYYHDDFINPTPENETVVYYRVSQTDFDGVVNTYDVLSCKCEASDKIKIHPVPSTDNIVINFGDQNNVPNSFQITDMLGRVVEDVVVIGTKEGNTSYKLDISNYCSGRYIIKINDWEMREDAVFIKK